MVRSKYRYAWKPQTTAEHHRPPQYFQENRSPPLNTGIYTVFRKKTPTHIFFHISISDV